MTSYPCFYVYRKPVGHCSRDQRVGQRDHSRVVDVPFDSFHRPYPQPKKYDFNTLEEAKDAARRNARALDLMLADYYILKVTEDAIEVAYGDPTVTVDGDPR
jgi:hypothetical protein